MKRTLLFVLVISAVTLLFFLLPNLSTKTKSNKMNPLDQIKSTTKKKVSSKKQIASQKQIDIKRIKTSFKNNKINKNTNSKEKQNSTITQQVSIEEKYISENGVLQINKLDDIFNSRENSFEIAQDRIIQDNLYSQEAQINTENYRQQFFEPDAGFYGKVALKRIECGIKLCFASIDYDNIKYFNDYMHALQKNSRYPLNSLMIYPGKNKIARVIFSTLDKPGAISLPNQ